MPQEAFTMMILCLMVFTVTVCLLLLIGYIYGIWKQWKLSAGKVEYADDQIWEPFERAKGVFELTVDRLILPLKKLRGILPKNNKKDEEE